MEAVKRRNSVRESSAPTSIVEITRRRGEGYSTASFASRALSYDWRLCGPAISLCSTVYEVYRVVAVLHTHEGLLNCLNVVPL